MNNLDFNDYPITEEEVISVLGNNYTEQGDELVFACMGCRALGNDNHGDNLKFNKTKHILKCFAGCGYDSEIIGIIARRRMAKLGMTTFAPRTDIPKKAEKIKEIPQDQLDKYYWNCHLSLMKNKEILKKMFIKHTILPRTAAECLIGYDKTKDKLVFPSKAISANPTQCDVIANGAEYREYEGQKEIRRISGYEPKICSIYHSLPTASIGIICEGYKDAYNLLQCFKMTTPQLLDQLAIFSVQNGTNSINTNGCLQKINWNLFETAGILMDNDEAGDKATKIAQEYFPRLADIRKDFLGDYNDIQSLFQNEFGNKIDIDKALEAEWLKEYENEEFII